MGLLLGEHSFLFSECTYMQPYERRAYSCSAPWQTLMQRCFTETVTVIPHFTMATLARAVSCQKNLADCPHRWRSSTMMIKCRQICQRWTRLFSDEPKWSTRLPKKQRRYFVALIRPYTIGAAGALSNVRCLMFENCLFSYSCQTN